MFRYRYLPTMGLLSPAEAKAKAELVRAAAALKKKREKRFKPVVAAKTKPRVAKPRSGVYFQSRGKHKCVKVDGQSQKGVHNALKRSLYPAWNYDKAQKAGLLTSHPLPPHQIVVSADGFVAKPYKYPPGAAKAQGIGLDRELSSITDMHVKLGVPLHAFVNTEFRDRYLKLNLTKAQGTKLRNLANRMKQTTGNAVLFLIKCQLEPVATQVVVAHMGVGTNIDMLVRDSTGAMRVLEFKLDCSTSFGQRGLVMKAPYAGKEFTTHSHYLLQTLLNHQLYKCCIAMPKGLTVGSPLLVRCEARGTYAYELPAWVLAGASQLLPRLSR